MKKKLVWRKEETDIDTFSTEIKDKDIEEININGINFFLKDERYSAIENLRKLIFIGKIETNFDEIEKEIFKSMLKRFKIHKKDFLIHFLRCISNIYILNVNFDIKNLKNISLKNMEEVNQDFFKFLLSIHIFSFKDITEMLDKFLNFTIEEE